jgi:NAD(P)-dependent dehydrogenase (short-subunit alcohol dehydrogenase family)
MEASLNGQVAIVTGAGQGIGRAIALRLARDLMQVVVVDMQAGRAQTVAAEIEAAGGRALALAADVTAAADRQRMLDAALAAFGRLDVLVNNAGIMRVALPLDVTEEHWDVVMDVNARAVYFCCQVALKHMIGRRSGRIVNIASAAGKASSTIQHPVYNVSKAAVIAMTKTFAMACARDGVRVNAICPGVVATPMQEVVDQEFARVTGSTPEAIRAERVARIPLGRVEQPEEVADVVAFLAGPDSRYMTGQAINVTGGTITY